MKTRHYQTDINASAAHVYETMLGPATYNQWTAEFNPTSTYEGSWETGSRIHFIGTNKEGKKEGMVAEIKENIPNQFVSIRHLGILDDGQEITEGPKVEGWAGALENYTFTETNGVTTVAVAVDTNDEYADYFNETWPKALNRLKEISEAGA